MKKSRQKTSKSNFSKSKIHNLLVKVENSPEGSNIDFYLANYFFFREKFECLDNLKGDKKMVGAIIGDIVGSRFEFNNYRKKDFELFTDKCFVTDDSIMTLAIGKAIMETEREMKGIEDRIDSNYKECLKKNAIKYMQSIGRKYPRCGYGMRFFIWMLSDNPQPYNSLGNEAAMRISSVGNYYDSESEIKSLSKYVTKASHNHEEGLKGAESVAISIFKARMGYNKEKIKQEIQEKYYKLNFSIDEIRDIYQYNETCQETVPQAIQAFLESDSFEDTLRIAVSVGGDSDILAAIVGSIAESFYGVLEIIKEKALTYLDKELRKIFDEWEEFMENKRNK